MLSLDILFLFLIVFLLFLIVKRVNYCILEVDIVVQSIKELKLTDSM